MATDEERGGLRRRLFAAVVAAGGERYERVVAARKRALLSEVHGTVLEIGPGAGANLRYYPADVRWIGVEPNPYMDRYLRKEAERLGLAVEVRRGTAERLLVGDASVDAVVSTLVLCSVDDLGRALRETLRVLKPGGRFVFLEHVAAPRGTWLRRLQRLVRPVWRVVADGCHPDRETDAAIAAAGFAEVRLERFSLPMGLVGPHIAGVALKGPSP